MYKSVLLIAILLLYNSGFAQKQTAHRFHAGIELDALPYATGGWFAAAWAGNEQWRIRLLTAAVNKPDFTTRKGFTNHHIRAYAAVADYSLKKDWEGFWLGGGLVLWNSTIQTDARLQTASFTNYLLNGSAGYHFTLHKNIYLSPWAGLSIRTGGDKDVAVDTKQYTLPLLNPEASVKIGFWF
ncbi:hypothetical protein PDL71_06325 [Lacibacter sp. MH-610]|uniref:hypothetical protein n=1 Tax=Lacibacter sp. MH-610 TaxID=3020883 RepID=UPI0038911A29